MTIAATLPTGQRGRVLAIGMTLVAMLALWGFVIAPLANFYTSRAAILIQRAALAERMEQVAATRPALETRLAQSGKTAQPSRTLDGSSDAVATAALQSTVQDIAATVGASLTTVESLPASAAGKYRRIGLKLSLSAPWPVIVRLLETIAQSSTPIAVDDLQLRSMSSPSQPQQQQALDAGFTVYAFADTGAAPGTGQ